MHKENKTKYIFVTGGVVSGIGKGISAASIGNILKAKGFKILMQKLDPYLNIDPGVLSPYEHGEVYVTKDGGETDLDLGHYERFLSQSVERDSSWTSGKIYQRIFEKERKGFYEGSTVQIIPHFTNEIQEIIKETTEKHKPDFYIVEIGGTVGDTESISFIQAAAEFSFRNRDDVFFIHTTYVPWLHSSKEFKTKPTQFSIATLSSLGIKPNIVLLRSQYEIMLDIRTKISKTTFLPVENIISIHDIDSVYKIPNYLESQNVSNLILDHFNMKSKKTLDTKVWNDFVEKIDLKNKKEITIAFVGKYVEYEDAYKSISEALYISATHLKLKLKIKWVLSESIIEKTVNEILANIDGVVILPGFGKRGFHGKLVTAEFTRIKHIPTLGICYGMQAMTINQALRKGINDATSSEIDEDGTFIFDLINKDAPDKYLGGSMRLGDYDITFQKQTKFNDIYGNLASERHRHRYEVNDKYISELEDNDFIFSGRNPQSGLVETCEVMSHPFYLGTQYHPEFNASILKPHPLFTAFLEVIKKK